jgi:DNA-binding transcriptional LysR family regulator
MEFDLTRLRHITTIHRLRSFSRAAEELNITQPALSRSVATFEQRCGLRIFDRGRGGAVPTAVGEAVIQEMERLLRSAHDLRNNLRLYRDGEVGRIAFGVGPLAASLILPRLSQRLLRDRPRVHLVTSIKPAEQLLEQLLDDDIEMIFANSWKLDSSPDVEVASIGSIPMAIFVRTGHPLASRKNVRLDELQDYPAASAVELAIEGLPASTGGFVCDNYHILKEAVLGTDCTWLAAPSLLLEDIQAGRLCQLELTDLGPLHNDLALIRRRERAMSPVAKAVIERVREICEPRSMFVVGGPSR